MSLPLMCISKKCQALQEQARSVIEKTEEREYYQASAAAIGSRAGSENLG